MKATGPAKRNQNFTKKKQYGWNTILEDGIGSNKDKTKAINNLKAPISRKTLKSFLGAIQYFAKVIQNLSKKTDNMRQLLEKGTNWDWTEERNLIKNSPHDHV